MNLSPEMKQALLAALSEGGGSPDHPDAAQDYDQICAVIEEKLAPVFQMIGAELKSLRDENADLKDIVYKLITSFHDGVNGYKQNNLRTSVLPKYSDELGLYGPAIKEVYGTDIESDLLSALMNGDGEPDDIYGQVMRPYKQRLGKYLGGAPAPGKEISVEVEARPADAQGELGLEEPKTEGETPSEEGRPAEKTGKASDDLFEKLKSLQRKTA